MAFASTRPGLRSDGYTTQGIQVMTIRGVAASAALGLALLLGGCGGGSGRSGTDLAVTGTGPSSTINGGDQAIFQMTVVNQGDYTADNLTIRNVTSQITTASLAITCTASGGATCPSATSATMTVSSMPAGGKLVFQISGTSVLGASGNVSDTMSVSSESSETDSTNNTATASSPVVSNDVSVTATAPAGPLTEGPATFTMVVANAGPDGATNVSLATTTSSTVTFTPSGITCVNTTSTAAQAAIPTLQSDGTLLTTSIPAGASLTCSVPVTVKDATNGFAIVTMTATAAGDSHSSNNSGTASVSATLTNDLSVTATAPAGPLTGTTATFKMVVANAGPSDATQVTLTNTLSSGLTLASIACAPSGGATAPVTQTNGTLIAASMPANSQLTCTIVANILPGTNGTVADTMSASVADDPKTGNNQDTASVQATLVNNVNVAVDTSTAHAVPASVPGGGSTTFWFVVGNSGPATAANVTLTNTLSSTTDIKLNGAFACTAANGAAAPTAGTGGTLVSSSIPVGGTLTCSVPVTITAGVNGTVGTTLAVTAANDQVQLNNSATSSTVAESADLGVSQSVDSSIPAGSSVVFKAVVGNPRSSGTLSNISVNWTHSQPAGVTFGAPTCQVVVSGASCPTTLGASMTISSMLTGAQLQFTFTGTTTSAARGAVTSTVTIAAAGDPNPANNTITTTTSVVDPRNGTYQTYAADGKAYTLAFDFDKQQYTVSGSSQTRSFTAGTTSDEFVVGGTKTFRVAQDLIVGGDDFGSGTLPYVGARSFTTTVGALAGLYNLAFRNTPTSGAATTHAATAQVSGNTLFVCENSGSTPSSVANCATNSLKSYNLVSNSDQSFTGTETTSGDTYTFVVANSGASKVLLSAGAVTSGATTTQQFVIGLPNAPAVAGGTFGAASSNGDWGTMTLTSSSYSFVGALSSDSAVLGTVSGINGMATGPRASDTASIYVFQANPVAVTVGGYATLASGLLQIGLP